MRCVRPLICGLVLLASPLPAFAQAGWSLYAPNREAEGGQAEDEASKTDGAAYLESLAGLYGDSFFMPGMRPPRTLAEKQAFCVQRLKQVDQQMALSLNGFSYDLNLTIEGAGADFEGISCRIQTSRDAKIRVEVKDN